MYTSGNECSMALAARMLLDNSRWSACVLTSNLSPYISSSKKSVLRFIVQRYNIILNYTRISC